jgi:L,D-peptidoglycan transpeptidase YkuD (ErfK/YbiS/YcfS/YnhG family)
MSRLKKMGHPINHIVLGWALALGLLVTTPGCVQKAPEDELAAIESLDQQLMEMRAAEYASEEYGRFVKHWLAFKSRLQADEDVIRWPWEANPLLADLRRIQEEGARVADLATQKRDAERREAEVRLVVLEQRVQGFTERISQMGGRAFLGQRPVEMELLVKQARSHFDQGAYARAIEAGQQAARVIEDQAAILNSELGRYADARNVEMWRRMVHRTIEWSRVHRAAAVVVNKADRRLMLYRNGRLVGSYPVQLGYNGILEKRYQGDGATPEGMYRIVKKRDRGQTSFYKALLLDYPNPEDRRRFHEARSAGVIPAKAYIGGQIEIHGGADLPMSQTLGCVMLSDGHIDMLFQSVKVGTPVTIVGAVNVSNSVAMTLAELEQSQEG